MQWQDSEMALINASASFHRWHLLRCCFVLLATEPELWLRQMLQVLPDRHACMPSHLGRKLGFWEQRCDGWRCGGLKPTAIAKCQPLKSELFRQNLPIFVVYPPRNLLTL
ncbi:MAG: hypothetical protein NW224_07290 [Leptolyngbyaceae cyanobacterium bins.302]|nr:hypothetical protein [Leptolyngbyaceae cyanobacterium bins.302]